MKKYFHLCKIEDEHGINECYENECYEDENGKLWFIYGMNSFAIQINYCPYCGFEADEPLEIEG